MSYKTRFIARLAGLYCLIAALAMLLHPQGTIETVTALAHDRALMFIVGIFTVAAGLAWVLAHNLWSGGTTTVAVTVLGWVTLLKGLLLLLSPASSADLWLVHMQYARYMPLYASISLLLGVYFTYAGFRCSRASSE
jgi:hypothetical protein